MKTSITFTNTLSPRLMSWLDTYTSEEGVSKKAVIEAALTLYQIQSKKKKMAQMFKEASGDVEMLGLAEAGLGDYIEQLNAYEK